MPTQLLPRHDRAIVTDPVMATKLYTALALKHLLQRDYAVSEELETKRGRVFSIARLCDGLPALGQSSAQPLCADGGAHFL